MKATGSAAVAVSVALGIVGVACSDGGGPSSGSSAAITDDAVGADGGTGRANGTVGAWTEVAAMPTPRANHCAVAVGDQLVVIGGNFLGDSGSFVSLDEIDVATVKADGTLGPWKVAGHAPSALTECTAAAHGSTLYIVGGLFADDSASGQVWSAELATSAQQTTLGAWKSVSTEPAASDFAFASAWFEGDRLYVMDSDDDGNVTGTYSADLAHGLSNWTTSEWLKGFRGHPQYATNGAYIYTLGGYQSDDAGDSVVGTDVHGIAIEADGGLHGEAVHESMLDPTAFGSALTVDDYLFITGGKAEIFTGGTATVSSTHILDGGALAKWQHQTALPEGRTSHVTVLIGSYLYVTGGGFNGPGLDTVYAARVRF